MTVGSFGHKNPRGNNPTVATSLELPRVAPRWIGARRMARCRFQPPAKGHGFIRAATGLPPHPYVPLPWGEGVPTVSGRVRGHVAAAPLPPGAELPNGKAEAELPHSTAAVLPSG